MRESRLGARSTNTYFFDFDLSLVWAFDTWILHALASGPFAFDPSRIYVKPFLPEVVFWQGHAPKQPTLQDTPAPPAGDNDDGLQDIGAQLGDGEELVHVLEELLENEDVAAEFEHAGPAALQAERRPMVSRRPYHGASGPSQGASARSGAAGDGAHTSPAAGLPAVVVAATPAAPPPPPPPDALEARPGGEPDPTVGARGERRHPGRRKDKVWRYSRLAHPLGLGPDGDHCIRLVVDPLASLNGCRAICGFHEDCSLSRTLYPGPRSGQGRPMAYLWAWLPCANEGHIATSLQQIALC